MIYKSIKNFKDQFSYEPKIENETKFKLGNKFLVVGMGGSHLAADLLKIWNPKLDLIVYSDYNLPFLNDLKNRLVILSSYSGNTKETISAFYAAKSQNLNMAIITSGGKLLNLAKKYKIAYIQLPISDLQPRLALGFMIKAILKLINQNHALKKIKDIIYLLKIDDLEKKGQKLAKKLFGFIPVIYSSFRNFSLGYNWKIRFNETSKIPAFCHFFPEFNHNEIEGFNIQTLNKINFKNFYFIILKDNSDDIKIKKRMEVFLKIYKKMKFKTETIETPKTNNIFYKIFYLIILADWTSYYLAKLYGVDPERVSIIENFKKLISN